MATYSSHVGSAGPGAGTFTGDMRLSLRRCQPGHAGGGRRRDAIEKRVALFLYRVVEEFYDLENDPDALHNLIDDPAYAGEVERTWQKRDSKGVSRAEKAKAAEQ